MPRGSVLDTNSPLDQTLVVVAPLWPYQHTLPRTSHYADGLWGVVGENSFALAIILLIAFLPWRTGAEPAFDPSPRRGPVRF